MGPPVLEVIGLLGYDAALAGPERSHYALRELPAYPERMSLVWWLPAVLIVAVAWWRLRPRRRTVREADLRRMQRVLGRGR
jgi:membrane protein implicated in regulation of membrane protease activity